MNGEPFTCENIDALRDDHRFSVHEVYAHGYRFVQAIYDPTVEPNIVLRYYTGDEIIPDAEQTFSVISVFRNGVRLFHNPYLGFYNPLQEVLDNEECLADILEFLADIEAAPHEEEINRIQEMLVESFY